MFKQSKMQPAVPLIKSSSYITAIQNPFLFFFLMACILLAIITIWLFACGILLQIPVDLSKPFDSLGFVFGWVWGFFASTWALLVLVKPESCYFETFIEVLLLHLQHNPVLYLLHFMCLVALIWGGIYLYKGLIQRTLGLVKSTIKVVVILFIIALVVSVIYLLFSDMLGIECQPTNINAKSSWFDWFKGARASPPCATTIVEMATNVMNTAQATHTEVGGLCQQEQDIAFQRAEREALMPTCTVEAR